ncbi:heme-degrading domain-containing protein [Rhodoferax sp.]|uniref:heme-degrading domain-containing protein n=1 Tax=Rhodoferax sp. TaxID=50421 RepID=UPI00284B1F8F|nr:heme-degrading domain-containing protein [Rhodoferax sp.]MDR3368370.1 heme-degrading domain-containing protein [Rhodoferax sp.]
MNIEKDIAAIANQEARLRFKAFDEDTAWALGSWLRTNIKARGDAVVIEIRLARETVFFHAMPGTAAANADWARRKRNTVELLKRSSYATGLALQKDQSSLEVKMGLSTRDYASHGGSFPIMAEGVGFIGTVTVSGLPQREDHAVVVQALAELCGVPIQEIALE